MIKSPKYAAEGIVEHGGSSVDDSTCFFDSTVAGIGRKGKTTAEMLLKSTYKDYDFETVWEQEHSEAERTGDSVTNFIEWVNACMKEA